MTIVDDNMNWMKLTHLLSSFSLNLRAPFCTSTFTSYFLRAFWGAHSREKQHLSVMYITCANASNNTPYTHVDLYMV